ncbi:MAG: pilus assembly protein Flp/PilA [Acidimicrobiales bacterium]|jgi:pilus assembly protein Flp/PilA
MVLFHRFSYSLRDTDDERGASLVEYALLIALLAVVIVSAVTVLGGTTSAQFSEIQSGVSSN